MEDFGIKQNVISKSEEGSILRLEKGGCYDIAFIDTRDSWMEIIK